MMTERTHRAAIDGGCQEIHPLSKAAAYPCNAKAVVVVWSKHEGRSYRMCATCADQNVKNNGMVIAAGFNVARKAAMMTNTENGNGKTEEPTISFRVSWVDENDAEQKLSFALKADASKQAIDMSTTHGAARLDTIADTDVVECTLYEKGIEMTSVNPSSIEKPKKGKKAAKTAKPKAAKAAKGKAAKPAKEKKARTSKVDGIAGEFGLRAESTRAKVLMVLEKAPKRGIDLKSLSKEALGNASETSVGLTNGAVAFLGGRIKKSNLPYKIEKVKDEEGGSVVTFSRK